MKVTVHDHVIVGAQGRTSMRAMGLFDNSFRPIADIRAYSHSAVMNDTDEWSRLTDACGAEYDPRCALAAIASGNPDEGYDELWRRVHHQGDLGTAAYAVVPELVRLMANADKPDWRAYALVATIEERRTVSGSAPVPRWLWDPYAMAMSDLVGPATKHLRSTKNDLEVRSLLAVIAQAKGERTLGAIALWTEDERREVLGKL